VTLASLKKIGISAVVTGWGSVTVEGPYAEIPVLAYTGISPHSGSPLVYRFDLESPDSFMSALNAATSYSADARGEAVESYAKFELMLYGNNLRCLGKSGLSAPLTSDDGWNSAEAYKLWLDNFDSSEFEYRVPMLRLFFLSDQVVYTDCAVSPGNPPSS